MRKQSLRLKHLAQEHQAVMRFISAVRSADPDDEGALPEIARRVREVFVSDLEPHFLEEERFALPMLRELGRAELADEVFAQHQQMRAMATELDTPTVGALVAFVHLLERHVELEEGMVWDVLEEGMNARAEATTITPA